MKIEEYNFGDLNGEEESKDDDFITNYFIRKKIIDKALKSSNYIVLGRQGSGKTVLSHYLVKNYRSDSSFISLVKFGELTTSSLSPQGVKLAEDDYYHIFEWTFLVELAKIVLTDNSISNSDENNSLRAALKIITTNFSIHKKTINQILSSGIEITSPFGGVKLNKNINRESLPIFTEELKILISKLLEESHINENRFLIFIDEIDDHLQMTEKGLSILYGMINAVYKVNFFIRNHNTNSKISLMLRNDMFYKLNNTYINKIRESHLVTLDWDRSYDWEHSDLAHIVAQKLRNSSNGILKNKSNEDILGSLFDDEIRENHYNSAEIGRFIMSRTFFRPRDVLKYFKVVQKNFGKLSRFSSYAIENSERDYSHWFKREISAELSTHFKDNNQVLELFSIISFINKKMFNYGELRNLLEKKNKKLKYFNLDEALKILFDFGILYQSFKPQDSDKRFFVKSYTNDGESYSDHPLFLENDFHLHYGLHKTILTNYRKNR